MRDLCARLPYGVKVKFGNDVIPSPLTPHLLDNYWYTVDIYLKPYLRPMSSMTEEEQQKYYDLTHQEDDDIWAKCLFDKMVDFCNEKHLDYRGLIPQGLALEATKGMYK